MATATADDVLAGWQVLWGTLGLPALVPGGLAHERPAADAPVPFALIKIAGGDRVELTGAGYWQPFTVTVEVRSAEGVSDRQPIAAALYGFDWTHDLVVANAQTIWVKPGVEAAEFDPATYQARDVALTRMAWEVMLGQGTTVETGHWFGPWFW